MIFKNPQKHNLKENNILIDFQMHEFSLFTFCRDHLILLTYQGQVYRSFQIYIPASHSENFSLQLFQLHERSRLGLIHNYKYFIKM